MWTARIQFAKKLDTQNQLTQHDQIAYVFSLQFSLDFSLPASRICWCSSVCNDIDPVQSYSHLIILVNTEQICGDTPFASTVFLLQSWWSCRNSNESCNACGGICILHLCCSLTKSRQQIFEQDGEAIAPMLEFEQYICYLKLLLAGLCGDDRLTFNIVELHLTRHSSDRATIVNHRAFMRNAVLCCVLTPSTVSKAQEQLNQLLFSEFDFSNGAKQLRNQISVCLSSETTLCIVAQLQSESVFHQTFLSDLTDNTVAYPVP